MNPLRLAVRTGLLVALLLIAGCEGGNEVGGADSTSQVSGGLSAEPAKNPYSRDQTAIAALSDGNVTFAEYDAATQRVVACVEAQYGPIIKRVRETEISYGFHISEANPAVVAFYDQCRGELLTDVQVAWVTQNSPSEEELQARKQAYAECLSAAGFNVNSIEDQARESREADAARSRCLSSSGEGLIINNGDIEK